MDEPGFGKAAPPDEKPPLFRVSGVKLHAWPIVVVILLAFGLPALGSMAVWVLQHFIDLPDLPLNPWMEYDYEAAAQLALAIFAIALMKPLVRADYGLHPPKGESYVGVALFWGLVLGALMTAVEYWPDITAHRAPSGAYELTPLNIAGWLSFRGFFLGLSDETLYRALLVTYLAATIPGRISILGFEMSIAGIIVAFIVSLTFVGGFFAYSFGVALLRMTVVFLQGVFFAYWFEKSKSLVAPVIGHGACFGLYQILIFAMVGAWG